MKVSQFMSKLKKNVIIGFTAFVATALVPFATYAIADTKTTTINAIIGSTISMTTSGTVNLNVTPVSGGAQTSAADTVTVATNNSTGYVLTLADSDATTTLVSGANSIAAHTGTQAASTVLANNSWGYHVDSIGNFGTGGAVESNVTSSVIKYAGVPATGSPNTLKTTATTTAGDVTTVYYAVKADTTKPSGTYTDVVTYTATTNP